MGIQHESIDSIYFRYPSIQFKVRRTTEYYIRYRSQSTTLYTIYDTVDDPNNKRKRQSTIYYGTLVQ